jgi:hypothetical protein
VCVVRHNTVTCKDWPIAVTLAAQNPAPYAYQQLCTRHTSPFQVHAKALQLIMACCIHMSKPTYVVDALARYFRAHAHQRPLDHPMTAALSNTSRHSPGTQGVMITPDSHSQAPAALQPTPMHTHANKPQHRLQKAMYCCSQGPEATACNQQAQAAIQHSHRLGGAHVTHRLGGANVTHTVCATKQHSDMMQSDAGP